MQTTPKELRLPSSFVLRSKEHVQPLAGWMSDQHGTATQKYGSVAFSVNAWVDDGNRLLTPHGVEIDMTPSLSWRDPHVYPVDGGLVFRELPKRKKRPAFRLLEPAAAFHEDPKRTMLRIIAKQASEMKTVLDIRLLSAIVWITVHRAILEDLDRSHEEPGQPIPPGCGPHSSEEASSDGCAPLPGVDR